jgi:catechol 2,3-dioxygenase-like lactoylglutathione lyase family enzyme
VAGVTAAAPRLLRVISGAHMLIYSRDAEADRAFVRDVLGLKAIDSGGGWLIFALPPSELAIHSAEESGRHEVFLLCDDLKATARELERKGARLTRPFRVERWGRVTSLRLPGGGELGLYQPTHPLAHARRPSRRSPTERRPSASRRR